VTNLNGIQVKSQVANRTGHALKLWLLRQRGAGKNRYRTARGSERDKNSTNHNHGAGAVAGDHNAEQIQISA